MSLPGDKVQDPESIEVLEEDVQDEADQILYMVENMSAVEKRRTLHKLRPVLEPLLSSTMIDVSDKS